MGCLSQLKGAYGTHRPAEHCLRPPRTLPIIAPMSSQSPPTEDEIVAALAAVQLFIEDNREDFGVESVGWHEASRLATQGLRPFRLRLRPSWGNLERLRRQTSGEVLGVVGL